MNVANFTNLEKDIWNKLNDYDGLTVQDIQDLLANPENIINPQDLEKIRGALTDMRVDATEKSSRYASLVPSLFTQLFLETPLTTSIPGSTDVGVIQFEYLQKCIKLIISWCENNNDTNYATKVQTTMTRLIEIFYHNGGFTFYAPWLKGPLKADCENLISLLEKSAYLNKFPTNFKKTAQDFCVYLNNTINPTSTTINDPVSYSKKA